MSKNKKIYGLIGYPLSHSFSKGYFAKKFATLGIKDCHYDNFPLEKIAMIAQILEQNPNVAGLNVTIPYKQQVIPFLDELDAAAAAIGAVNTIRIEGNKTTGFNTDVYGFEHSLRPFLTPVHQKGLILGTGGAAKAVQYVLTQLGITYQMISRTKGAGKISYEDLNEEVLQDHLVIVNTTPLGMSPNNHTFPAIPYQFLGKNHLLYDLVYNPEKTTFLAKGEAQGASTKNGLEMLHLQAEKAWEIWNT